MEDAPISDHPNQPDRKASRGPRDMVISLAVLLVPVLVLVGGYQLLTGRNQPVEVDQAPALAAAANAGMDVAAPSGLSDGWVPVSAVFQPDPAGDTVRLGYVTPSGASVQLMQTTLPAEQVLEAELAQGSAPAGTLTVAGQPWQRYTAPGDQLALVLLEPDRTVLVRGAAEEPELRTLAASS